MSLPPTSTTDQPEPRRKPRWLRRILILAALAVVLLIGLVLLGPTLAGTAAGRAIITSQINSRLNGTVKIDETSFGWFSGQKLGGIKVYDDRQSLIAEINRVETGLSLASAARGNLDLGATLLDVNLTRLQVDPNGNTNYAKLLKPATSTPGALAPDSRARPDSALPDIRANVTVRYRGTIEYVDRIGGSPLSPPLVIEPGETTVAVTNINDPIDITAAVAMRIGDRSVGKVEVSGKLAAIKSNRLDLDALQGSPIVKLTSIDLAAIAPLLRLAGVDGEFGGIVNGNLALRADGLQNAAVDGQITIANASAATPQLGGDTLRFSAVSIPIKVTRTVADASTTRLKIESLKIETPEAQIVASGEVTEQSLWNLAAAKPPGSDGWLSATVDVRDLAGIANQLRHTARLQDDVKLTGGRVVQQVELTLQPDKSFAKVRIDADAQGQRGGRAIAIKPVNVSLDATYLPAARPLHGLRDVAAVLTSSFATARGGGKTLDQLDFTGDFDLGRLKTELEQFIDFGGVNLAGRGSYSIGSRGDLSQPRADIAVSLGAQLADVDVRLPNQPQVKIGHLQLAADANLLTDESGGVAGITAAKVNAISGDSPNDKVLELSAAAQNVDPATASVQRFEVSNLAITSLPKLQQQFGAFVPALKENKLAIRDGQVYSKIIGAYNGSTKKLHLESADLSTPNLTIVRADAPLVTREKIVATAAGDVTLGQTLELELSTLNVTSSLLSLAKSDTPLAARIDPTGAITGTGRLRVAADLQRISDLAQAFGGGEAPAARVTAGKFDGTLDLSGGLGRESILSLDGAINALSVASTAGGAMQNETVALTARITTAADLSSARASAKVDSSFAKIDLTQADFKLGGGVYDVVQSARMQVGVPDLPKLQALAAAFAPPTASGAAKPSRANNWADDEHAASPSEPITITSGGAAVDIEATRSGPTLKINVPDLRISKLALARGQKKYAFDRQNPISLKLAADVESAGDQLRGLKVTQLTGDLRAAALEMTQPIDIALGGAKPSAAGAVRLSGDLQQARGLLELLGATPEGTEIAGTLQVTTSAATRGDGVTMSVAGTIDKFQLRAPDQKPVEQKQVTIDGAARLDTKSQVLSVDKFALKLPDNDVLAIDLTGGMVSLADLLVTLDNTKLQYSYDLEHLWPLALPFLDPQTQETLADTQIKGKLSRTIAFKGNYAAGKPFHEAIAGVSGDGAFDVEFLDSQGVTVNALSIPFKIDRGIVRITESKPASANNGTLNLSGLVVDLTQPVPRLSGPKKHRLLHNCSINPALGDSLGKYVNPIFPNSDRAKGILDVTIDMLDGVALGPELFTADSGRARIVFSITDMDIANPLGSIMFGEIIGKLNAGWASGQADVFKGEIRDAVITLEKGRTTQDVTIRLTEDVKAKDPVTGQTITVPRDMPMAFQGDIRLSDLRQSLKVTVPPALLAKFINASEKDMNSWFPSGVPITLGGTTLRPKADVGNIVQRLIEGRIRSGLGGGGDPVGNLLRGIGGGGRDDRRREDDRRRDQPPPRDERPR